MIFIGYVNQTNDKGCFIKIGENTTVRAALNELSDSYISKPTAVFHHNKIVLGRITQIKDNCKIEVSLRESIIKYGYNLDLDKMKVGMTVEGVVSGYIKGKASINI